MIIFWFLAHHPLAVEIFITCRIWSELRGPSLVRAINNRHSNTWPIDKQTRHVYEEKKNERLPTNIALTNCESSICHFHLHSLYCWALGFYGHDLWNGVSVSLIQECISLTGNGTTRSNRFSISLVTPIHRLEINNVKWTSARWNEWSGESKGNLGNFKHIVTPTKFGLEILCQPERVRVVRGSITQCLKWVSLVLYAQLTPGSPAWPETFWNYSTPLAVYISVCSKRMWNLTISSTDRDERFY
jgi:hypothetical protein